MSVNAWAHLTLTERSQFCLFALLVRSSVFVIEVRRLKSHLPHLKDYTFQFWPHYQLLRRERKFTSRCSRSLSFSVIHAYLLFWKHASVTFTQCHLIEWQKQLILKECHRRELISLAFYTLSGASNCLLLLSLLLFVIFPSRAGWHVCPYWKEQINSLCCWKWPIKYPPSPRTKTQVSEEQFMSDRLLMRASSIKMCVFADMLYN